MSPDREILEATLVTRARPTRFQHWSPNLGPCALRNLISPIQPSTKRGGTRGNGVEWVRAHVPTRFTTPLTRISDVHLSWNSPSEEKKKKKYPLEIRCTFVVYKRRRFKTLNFLSLTILLSASPMVLPPSQQFRNIIRTTIRGARSRSRRVNTRNVRIWVWLDTVHATHRFKEKLERKVEASEFKSHFRDIYLIRIHSESTIKTMNFRI